MNLTYSDFTTFDHYPHLVLELAFPIVAQTFILNSVFTSHL